MERQTLSRTTRIVARGQYGCDACNATRVSEFYLFLNRGHKDLLCPSCKAKRIARGAATEASIIEVFQVV